MTAWSILAAMLGALLCVAAGALGAWVLGERMWSRAAHFHRTGSEGGGGRVVVREEEPNRNRQPSAEVSAARAVTEDSIKRGVETVKAAYKAQGLPVPSDDVIREEVKGMVEGHHPLGGVS